VIFVAYYSYKEGASGIIGLFTHVLEGEFCELRPNGVLGSSRGGGSRKLRALEAGHDVGVRVLARSQGEPFVRALHLEAELPVERDGRFVGREGAQVQAREPNQLSARSKAASISFVPTPRPRQSSRTAIPKCPECLLLGSG
jgi:hypothetical protein